MNVLSFDGTRWSQQDLRASEVRGRVATDRLTWVRATGLPHDELEVLCKDFGIHPLALEDVQTSRQRPKVEDYPGMTFAVVRVPRWDDTLAWVQVGLFIGPDFIITASAKRLTELDGVAQRLVAKGLRNTEAGTLFHYCLDALVDAWFPYMDELETHVEQLELQASKSPDQNVLSDIREAKQIASKTRKVSGPMRDAVLSLERAEHPNIADATRIYLRDVSDHMVRIAERLEHVKEMAIFAQESWNAALANSQNQTMKRLTVVFALFLIPTFLAGMGGMNFEGIPDWPFDAVALSLFAFVAVGTVLALWKRWL